jgi:hypothetical protein
MDFISFKFLCIHFLSLCGIIYLESEKNNLCCVATTTAFNLSLKSSIVVQLLLFLDHYFDYGSFLPVKLFL